MLLYKCCTNLCSVENRNVGLVVVGSHGAKGLKCIFFSIRHHIG